MRTYYTSFPIFDNRDPRRIGLLVNGSLVGLAWEAVKIVAKLPLDVN